MLNNNYFSALDENQLTDINGGVISITICGVVFAGWKAIAIIAAGVTTLAGACGLGIYNGYKSNK